MDNSIDIYLKKGMYWAAPYFLSLYVYLYDFLLILFNQTILTAGAIKESFNNDKHLGFFKIDSTYIPAIVNTSDTFNIEPEWIFNFKTKTFTHCEIGHHNKCFRLPYIGATIINSHNDKETVVDLSEWINDIKVYASDSAIPLQLLAATWYYISNRSFIYNYNTMKLDVITDDGDTNIYELGTHKPRSLSEETEEGEIKEE
jgi:hypothetical protein